MQEHQKRVIDEKSELDEKLGKLTVFINENPIFKKLDNNEQNRLDRQKLAMEQYASILQERIDAF